MKENLKIINKDELKRDLRAVCQQRVAVLVDADNIIKGSNESGWRIDLVKVKDFLEDILIEVDFFIYDSYTDKEEKQKQGGFLKNLRYGGFHLMLFERKGAYGKTKFKRIVPSEVGLRGNLDVAIVSDLWRFLTVGGYRSAVLLSGDGDFTYPIKSIQNTTGKHIAVGSFREIASEQLLATADFSFYLDPLKGFLERRDVEILASFWGIPGFSKKRLA